MRRVGPFDRDDLYDLASLYTRAARVIPMRDVWKGDTSPAAIAVRHDVDDNPGAFETALKMAEWEFDNGWSTTYFLLHSADYWTTDNLVRALEFQELGHEVGIHVNAIAEAFRRRINPEHLLIGALHDLRSAGLRIDGCVAHGDPLCRDSAGNVVFVNDELFSESERPSLGARDRILRVAGARLKLEPQPLSSYHLGYDANWLGRGDYLSDSGRVWSQPFGQVCQSWPTNGQLHVLVHPDWWSHAFVEVAA